jgi:spore germination cell wall hydrolase CwlJ-like protein
MRGKDVLAVQTWLSKQVAATLPVNGVFDHRTCEAVRSYQQARKDLTCDGIVGPRTWSTLFGTTSDARQRVAAHATDGLRVLAKTLWGECRGEPREGKIAVAWVIRNRAATPAWWGKDIVSVCKKKDQFTCWHDHQATRVQSVDESDPAFNTCLEVARAVLDEDKPDPTSGADHYHTTDMNPPPRWSHGRKPTCVIGRHRFYKIGSRG